MCFDLEARPPAPPIFGMAASSGDLVLQAADGTRFAAFAARASTPTGAGIVILPDVRGLHQFYKDLAVRFAEAGVESVAVDYFGRTAGLTARDESFEYMPHVTQTTRPQIAADVAAAVAYLRSSAGGAPRGIFTVGFCFGGDASWTQAANGHGLAGAIGFYGRPTTSRGDGAPSVVDRVPEFACPILGLFGGADPGIPASDVQAFEDALTRAGKAHELHTYAGAPHSFFDRRATDYAAESEDAWRRMLGFIAAYSPGA
ncbi:MAG TPA: dienelactone hydrolase family protein [Ktedonobacterales bacterium]|nr:dienelactone hydrolase family protein [Ktedonobacterales bacterium]